MPSKTFSSLRARILCGVGFVTAWTVATLLAIGRGRLRAVPVAHAIALAGDVDDLGMMQEAIEYGAGRRYVADQLAPILQRSIRGHHRALQFITPHDDLEEKLPALGGKLLDPHVVNDEQ